MDGSNDGFYREFGNLLILQGFEGLLMRYLLGKDFEGGEAEWLDL